MCVCVYIEFKYEYTLIILACLFPAETLVILVHETRGFDSTHTHRHTHFDLYCFVSC